MILLLLLSFFSSFFIMWQNCYFHLCPKKRWMISEKKKNMATRMPQICPDRVNVGLLEPQVPVLQLNLNSAWFWPFMLRFVMLYVAHLLTTVVAWRLSYQGSCQLDPFTLSLALNLYSNLISSKIDLYVHDILRWAVATRRGDRIIIYYTVKVL